MAIWQIEDLVGGHTYVDCNVVIPDEVPSKFITNEPELRSALQKFVRHSPRVVCMRISQNEYLNIGIGGPWAFVEHVIDEPWKAAVALAREAVSTARPEQVSFICGNQDTDIPAQFLMPASEAIELVTRFYRDNRWPIAVGWELV